MNKPIFVQLPDQWADAEDIGRMMPPMMIPASVATPERQSANNPLQMWGGIIQTEWMNDLRGPRGQRIYREMRDACVPVAATVRILENIARKVEWYCAPASTPAAIGKRKAKQFEKESRRWADFVNGCMNDMSQTWAQLMTAAISSTWSGFCYLETVYKVRGGESKDQFVSSKYDDGLYGWRKFVNVGAQNVYAWAYTDDGKDLLGIWQYVKNGTDALGAPVYIPLTKSLHIALSSEDDNPEGRAMLRAAYPSWRNLKNLWMIEGLGFERNVGGIPILRVPPQLLMANATAEMQTALTAMRREVMQVRSGARTMITLPSEKDELGQPTGYDIKFAESAGGSSDAAIHAAIMRYSKEISLAMLADFLYLGNDKAGSYALSSDKNSMFIENVRGVFDAIAEEFTRQSIAALMKLNGVPSEYWPVLTYRGLDAPDIEKIGSYIEKLFRVGINTTDEETVRWLRQVAGLPDYFESQSGDAPATETQGADAPDTPADDTESPPVPQTPSTQNNALPNGKS